jgi:hypothetical protein
MDVGLIFWLALWMSRGKGGKCCGSSSWMNWKTAESVMGVNSKIYSMKGFNKVRMESLR